VIDISRAQPLLDQIVGPVVSEIHAIEPGLPPVMVVGAVCRDVLHAAGGHQSPLRRTSDLDVAVAVNGWDHFRSLTAELGKVVGSSSLIRYRIAGRTVDVVPFGDPVESPDGVVEPGGKGDAMSVFGFQDVWDSAYDVGVSSGTPVRVPSIPGYAVLKLKAWLDRSVNGEHKDGGDLAAAMYWYQQDRELVDQRIWGDAAGVALLDGSDFDEDEAAVRLLVADARALLARSRQDELAAVWRRLATDERLADHLHNPLLPAWPRRGDDRLLSFARAVRQVVTAGTSGVHSS